MKQTLITLVKDKPGVLNRISSLFRRRNFNIESLVVGRSETPGISRITIVTNETDSTKRGNIYFNLLKLINVISVRDVTTLPCIAREYVLIKVHVDTEKLNDINDVTKKFGARIVDMGKGSVIIEAAEEEKVITDLIKNLSQFNIAEIMRTGKIAMRRGIAENNSYLSSNNNQENAHWTVDQINNYLNS